MNQKTVKFQPLYRFVSSVDARIYYWCLSITLLWRLGLEVINQTIIPLMTPGPGIQVPGTVLAPGVRSGLLRWASAWDAAWYTTITQHGYVIVNHFKSYESIAFFPLFPYTVRVISSFVPLPYRAVGLALNVLFTSLAVYFLYQLTKLMAQEAGLKSQATKLSKVSVALLLLNPSVFFFAAYYADALLVMLVTASIYYGYKNTFIVAACCAGLATATKSIGLVLLPTLLILYWIRSGENLGGLLRKHLPKLVAMGVLSVGGLLTYMAYLWMRFGDPLIFLKIEKYWNRNVSGFFLNNIWGIWYSKIFNIHYFGSISDYMYSLFIMAIPVAILVFAIYVIIRHQLRFSWLAVMCVTTLLLPISTGLLLSLNRYVLLLTPA